MSRKFKLKALLRYLNKNLFTQYLETRGIEATLPASSEEQEEIDVWERLIRDLPPSTILISILLAPASMAFSTSSLTTLAGRSTTSPAAMRLTVSSGSSLIVNGVPFRVYEITVSKIAKGAVPAQSEFR